MGRTPDAIAGAIRHHGVVGGMRMEMARARLNGVDLYYERVGAGEQLVLTHGSWTDARTWDSVVGPLSERFEVVRWDRRGHSRSERGEGPGSWQEEVRDLAALIRHIGGGRVHLVGNSSGGSIVLGLVASHPDLVHRAVVHEPEAIAFLQASGDERLGEALAADDRVVESVLALIDAGAHGEAARRFVEMVLGPGSWEGLPSVTRAVLEANAPSFLDEHRRPDDAGSLVRPEALATSGVPVLLTYGTDSPETVAAASKELARLVHHARAEALPGAGHVPHRTHPEVWLASLDRFLTGALLSGGEG